DLCQTIERVGGVLEGEPDTAGNDEIRVGSDNSLEIESVIAPGEELRIGGFGLVLPEFEDFSSAPLPSGGLTTPGSVTSERNASRSAAATGPETESSTAPGEDLGIGGSGFFLPEFEYSPSEPVTSGVIATTGSSRSNR